MSDALLVNLGSADWPEKKGHDRSTSPYHFPMWVPPETYISAPGVFTNIYLKLITYAHILLIAMLYFDRIIQDLKLTKQKYIGLLLPHFCLLHKIFDVTVLAKPFVFHKTLWNFFLAANLPRDVWSNAIIWRNQNKSALTLCVWREVSRVHTFGPRVRNVNTAYSRNVFKGSEARKT